MIVIKRSFLNSIIAFSIILLCLYSVLRYFNPVLLIVIDKTSIWWVINWFILFLYFLSYKYFFKHSIESSFTIINVFLCWNIFNIGRGIFIAENYWDWKALISNSLALLLPIVSFSCSYLKLSGLILKVYLSFCLPLFLIIAFAIERNSFGFYLMPISFLIFFLPYLNKITRYKVVLFSFLVFATNLATRSTILKFLAPFALLPFINLQTNLVLRVLNFFRNLFFGLPLIFMFLFSFFHFNIFEINSYLSTDLSINVSKNGEIVEENLAADTRTLLYYEVIETANKYDTWFLGRSPSRGNETDLFADIEEITGRRERIQNEVAILNIFTWTGLIGVILYFLIFLKASYLAFYKSNNSVCKLLGVFVAFRWSLSWIEDINNFSINYFLLWLIIGLCLSSSFRNMTNMQIKEWIKTSLK